MGQMRGLASPSPTERDTHSPPAGRAQQAWISPLLAVRGTEGGACLAPLLVPSVAWSWLLACTLPNTVYHRICSSRSPYAAVLRCTAPQFTCFCWACAREAWWWTAL
jgi:hypothetical protein